jgi:hypothetical protein
MKSQYAKFRVVVLKIMQRLQHKTSNSDKLQRGLKPLLLELLIHGLKREVPEACYIIYLILYYNIKIKKIYM